MNHYLSFGSVTEQHHGVFLYNPDDGSQHSFLMHSRNMGNLGSVRLLLVPHSVLFYSELFFFVFVFIDFY